MKSFLGLAKEFCSFNVLLLKITAIIMPVVVWKFVFPEDYYKSPYSLYVNASLYLILPFLFAYMTWEFIKFKKRKPQSDGSKKE